MKVLQVFEMEETKVAAKESNVIAIYKDALLAIETLIAKVVCIKKHGRAHAMAL